MLRIAGQTLEHTDFHSSAIFDQANLASDGNNVIPFMNFWRISFIFWSYTDTFNMCIVFPGIMLF